MKSRIGVMITGNYIQDERLRRCKIVLSVLLMYLLLQVHTKNVLSNLWLKVSKAFTSAITRHHFGSGHGVIITNAFKMINRQKTTILLHFAEAIAIKHFQPNVYIQKESVISFSLPY